jgi:DNA polymerase IV
VTGMRDSASARFGRACLEAYLDVTENLQAISLARDVASAIRSKIKEVIGLNASAGISYNKFLAKLASDHHKPNG